MRILFLTNAYPDFESSYRGIFIKKMASFLLRDGYEITVVTPKIYKRSDYFEGQNRIKVYRFPFLSGNKPLIEYKKIPYFRMILYYLTGFFFSIYALIKHKCHLIHVHWAIPTGLIGVLAGALLNKPFIVTIHGSDFRLATSKSSFLRQLFIFVCRKAKHLICVSEIMKKETEQMGIREENISVFPMGVDEAFFEAGRRRKKGLGDRPLTILSNRNLINIYNISLLIRAVPLILREEPHTRFIIAGEGPEREDLEMEARSLNIVSSVQFLGRVPHEEMPSLLGQADIYVSTSLFDGTSVSLLEALASGTFPVVTDIPSNREWIADGENGFLTPTNEEKFLAKRIVDAIRNKALLEKSRLRNLQVVEEKTLWRVIMEKVENIYKESLYSKN